MARRNRGYSNTTAGFLALIGSVYLILSIIWPVLLVFLIVAIIWVLVSFRKNMK